MNFSNKNIIITGSSAGIGKASAELFIKQGANVIINGASLNGQKVQEELKEKYPSSKVIFVQADVSKISECEKLFNKAIEEFKTIDVLVNCAGIVPSGTVLDFSEEEYDEAFDINVKSTFFLSKLVVKHMIENKKGVICNVGSIAGLIGPKNRALYSATKGAIISLSRAMASDYAGTGVRINCVCPGMVYSPSLKKRIDATDDPEKTHKQFEEAIPIKRIGQVEEIAQTICFACSEENSFMTGSIITVDGGASL